MQGDKSIKSRRGGGSNARQERGEQGLGRGNTRLREVALA
jgi:hypothetical protein